MRGGAVTLATLLVTTITLPGPAGAGVPPDVVQEYYGHFDVGCLGERIYCSEVHYLPNHNKTNRIRLFATEGTGGTSIGGDLRACALGPYGIELACFGEDGGINNWIPADTVEWQVWLGGTIVLPDVDIDYALWLSCSLPNDPLSEVPCTPP